MVQTALLFGRLDLLPGWGDEQFTLETVRQPLSRIAKTLNYDIHPPLYYLLLHFWFKLPLPGSPLVRLRVVSALCALLTSIALDRLWLRQLKPWHRLRFLTLWALSPCLLLYARMARSYSLQVLLAVLTIWAGSRLLESPLNRMGTVLYVVCGSLLLYTHYAPGIAIPLAISLVGAAHWYRQRSAGILAPVLLAPALMLAVYLPWFMNAARALGRWTRKEDVYSATGNVITEQGLKLARWFFTFSFGETFFTGALVLAVCIAPLVAFALARSLRGSTQRGQIAALAAALGYLGASRWVAHPFIAARLLFVYPFFLLWLTSGITRPRWRKLLTPALAVVSAFGAGAYFERIGYLNKGYCVPFEEMAERINRSPHQDSQLIVLDTLNSDAAPFRGLLSNPKAVVLLTDEAAANRVRASVSQVRTVWFWRNTHDVSRGRFVSRLESELAPRFRVTRQLYQPYSFGERLVIRLFGWPDQPSHFYQLLEMRRPDSL